MAAGLRCALSDSLSNAVVWLTAHTISSVTLCSTAFDVIQNWNLIWKFNGRGRYTQHTKIRYDTIQRSKIANSEIYDANDMAAKQHFRCHSMASPVRRLRAKRILLPKCLIIIKMNVVRMIFSNSFTHCSSLYFGCGRTQTASIACTHTHTHSYMAVAVYFCCCWANSFPMHSNDVIIYIRLLTRAKNASELNGYATGRNIGK